MSFVLFGSGPGNGLAVAKAFALSKQFNRIALCARSEAHLAEAKAAVQAAVGNDLVEVRTFVVDLSDVQSLGKVLPAIEALGPVGMVYHNAARIKLSPALEIAVEEVEWDIRVSTLSLYKIAQWAIPLLKAGGHPSPSFFATNSHFPEAPMPVLLSLSIAKAAQQYLILGLSEAFGSGIHFGVVKVCGRVSEQDVVFNPTNVGRKALQLFGQDRSGWSTMMRVE